MLKRKNSSSSIMTLGKCISVFFVVGVILNLFLPVCDEMLFNKQMLQFCLIAVWVYGLLCSKGIIKKIVSENSEGVIEYTTSVPIVQIGVIRIAEVLWFVFRHSGEVIWRNLGILVIVDVVYVALMLADKMNYYYIGVREKDEEV